MNGKDLLTGLSHISRKYIEESEQDMPFVRNETGNDAGIRFRNPLMLAAILALTLLLAGCAVVYALHIKDLHIGQVTRTQYGLDENRQPVSQTEVVLDVISAQGIMGSSNFQAAQEWLEFDESYEPDPTAAENFVIPAGYEVYRAYSQEMVDKVNEICQKYSLKPMGTWVHMQSYQFEVLYQALGFDSLFHGGVEVNSGVGYFTECGNFNVMLSFTLTSGEADWKQPIGATLHYADKAYFDTTVFSVGNADTVKQRNYTLADGTTVLIVGEGNQTILLYDREDAFLSLYFDTYSLSGEEQNLSHRDVERIAEAIDFTIKPQKPDMVQVAQLLAEAEAAHAESLFADAPKTYEEVLAGLDGNLYYTLADLNRDGEEELLVGTDAQSFGQLYTKVGGSYILYTMLWVDPEEVLTDPSLGVTECAMYLCEDQVYEVYQICEDGSFSHAYCKLENNVEKNGVSEIAFVRYDAETGKWHSKPIDRIYDKAAGTYVPYDRNDIITEAEAQKVIQAHPRVELNLLPISQTNG